MGKQSKATKRFEKRHLKDAIDRRKDFAKVKQRHQLKAKKRHQTNQNADPSNNAEDAKVHESKDSIVKSMDEDAYYQDTIVIPEDKIKTAGLEKKRKRDQDAQLSEPQAASSSEESDELDAEFGAHAEQLKGLAEKDPEFYAHLQANDPELLDFYEDDDLLGIGSDEDDAPRAKKLKKTGEEEEGKTPSNVTKSMVEKWRNSMQSHHSLRALRELVLAFRAAAHMDEAEEKHYKYWIPDSDVYHEVMITALKEAPDVLAYHIPIKEAADGKVRVMTDSPKFRTLSPLIRSYAALLQYLLGHLSDAATLRMTLRSFEPLLPYLLQFRKFLKVIIKSVASIWSDNSSDEATRINAFLILRKLTVIGDAGIKEAVLKSSYEGIVRGSRNTTIHTLSGINLMKNSAAEIWGLDQKISYTTGFTFIRQLAIHLRGNIIKPTKDSFKTIYNWQFVHSLDFWSRVLATHCNSLLEAQNGKESELRPLIYPVVQITMGVMRMIPTPTYFPLRFQLMRALLRISRSTGTYIPLSAALLEVLDSSEMKKSAKPSTLKALDFASIIRAPASYSKTRVYQDGIGEQVTDLLSEFLVLWSKSIAFPELQLPVIVMLKRWLKATSKGSTGNKNGKLNQSILLLVQKSEANSRWIQERRNKVSFTPKARAEVEAFLKDVPWEDTPLGAFVVSQRRIREERSEAVDAGRREEERRRTSRKDVNSIEQDL